MSEISKKAIDSIPWALVIALSIFLGAFGIAWLQFLPSNLFSYYNFGSIVCQMSLMSAPFIVLIFTALFSKLTRRSVGLMTLTYLYAIAMTCSLYVSAYDPVEYAELIASRYLAEDWSAKYLPWFMAPSTQISGQLVTGHIPIPWGEWLPSILHQWFLFVLIGIFLIAVATLFRRQWVDVERVPFMQALLAYELVRRIPMEKKSLMERLGKPFLLGIFLGLAFQIPIFMTVVFPWFPDLYGWKTLCASGQWYVTGTSPLAGIVGLSAFNMHPILLAIGYLVPLSISFNAWFWHLIYLILMQIAYAMGYYTGIESEGGCGRAWCSPSGLTDPPFKFMAVSYGGGLLGLAVIVLILSRRYISETLRAAFQRGPSALSDLEKNEPLTYRNTYILLGSSFILLVLLFILDGMGILAAFLVVISYFLYWLSSARFYGLAGLMPAGAEHGNTLLRLMMWPTPPDPPTSEYVLAAHYLRRGIGDPVSISGGSIFTGFTCYKMASLTGTSSSGVLKIMLVSTVITPIIALITYISLCYTYGATALPGNGGNSSTNQFYNYSNPANWIRFPARDPLGQYVIAGFIIVVGLEFLHSRFVWFPFNAIGFIFGTSYMSVLWGYWGPFLIAWILKTITLRVGGSKLYENAGVPVAGGFVVGNMVAVIFGGTMGVLRFFIPY